MPLLRFLLGAQEGLLRKATHPQHTSSSTLEVPPSPIGLIARTELPSHRRSPLRRCRSQLVPEAIVSADRSRVGRAIPVTVLLLVSLGAPVRAWSQNGRFVENFDEFSDGQAVSQLFGGL